MINKSDNTDNVINDDNIHFIGKIAKFPKNTKISKAYSFMENVKIPKNKIWYILIQKQNDELSMVKYNRVEGVDLNTFVNQLKEFYESKYSADEEIIEAVNKLEVVGENKFSLIKNIPYITIDGVPFITKITEDLLKILGE